MIAAERLRQKIVWDESQAFLRIRVSLPKSEKTFEGMYFTFVDFFLFIYNLSTYIFKAT